MADKEEWSVDGYQFGSAKDASQAKSELLKIQKLEDKMDYRNPHMIYMVYHKAIENRIFKTPVGYEYLRKLQKHLKENPLIREPVQDVPVNNVYSLRDSTNPAVEKVKASTKLEAPSKGRTLTKFSQIPMIKAPITAPGIEPMPPNTAATKAFSPGIAPEV